MRPALWQGDAASAAWETWFAQTQPAKRRAVSKLIYHAERYRRFARIYQNKNWFLRFPTFLRDTWNLPNLREVPKYIFHYTTTRVAARFKSPPARLREDS